MPGLQRHVDCLVSTTVRRSLRVTSVLSPLRGLYTLRIITPDSPAAGKDVPWPLVFAVSRWIFPLQLPPASTKPPTPWPTVMPTPIKILILILLPARSAPQRLPRRISAFKISAFSFSPTPTPRRRMNPNPFRLTHHVRHFCCLLSQFPLPHLPFSIFHLLPSTFQLSLAREVFCLLHRAAFQLLSRGPSSCGLYFPFPLSASSDFTHPHIRDL